MAQPASPVVGLLQGCSRPFGVPQVFGPGIRQAKFRLKMVFCKAILAKAAQKARRLPSQNGGRAGQAQAQPKQAQQSASRGQCHSGPDRCALSPHPEPHQPDGQRPPRPAQRPQQRGHTARL